MDVPQFTPKAPFFLLSGVLILGVLALGLYDLRLVRSPDAAGNTAKTRSLGLKAERDGGVLKLTWNPLVEPLKTAERVELQIDDGGRQRRLVLTPGQVRSGSVTYSSVTDNVAFHLQAFGHDGAVANETLQVVQSRPSQDVGPADPVEEPVSAAPVQRGGADRRGQTVRALPPPHLSNGPTGSIIVRGTILHDTPVDVKIAVDANGRPIGAPSERSALNTGSVFHHLTRWSKKATHLWPFHTRVTAYDAR